MSEKLQQDATQTAALDLERRRIALRTAAELHDARDLSGLMATASNVYGWLTLPSRTILKTAEPRAGERAQALIQQRG